MADQDDRSARADSALWTAIMDHAASYELARPDELLNHFAIVCHWTREEADGRSRYTTHFHTPEVPLHVAEGLFWRGIQLVNDTSEDDGSS